MIGALPMRMDGRALDLDGVSRTVPVPLHSIYQLESQDADSPLG
jgi:hypothetical protein